MTREVIRKCAMSELISRAETSKERDGDKTRRGGEGHARK